jgi:hypothetical protein
MPSFHFELDSIEGRLQEMDVAPIASDDELAIGPRGVFVSADVHETIVSHARILP